MTHTTQREDVAIENGVPHLGDNSDPPITHRSSVHPAMDSASDNDTSERPVREKLKKTSIASIPTSSPNPPRNEVTIGSDPKIAAQKSADGISRGHEAVKAHAESRGRPLKKRSFNDLESEEVSTRDQSIANQSAHSRKRSRDVRVGEDIKGDERLRGSGQVPVQEEEEEEEEEEEADMVNKKLSGSRQDNKEHTTKGLSRSSHQDVADQEMRDSAFSPRKKRSRDQLDTETHREQKIPATEEAKAHRRSEENEREGTLHNGNVADNAKVQSMQDEQPKSVGEQSEGLNVSPSVPKVYHCLVAHVAEGTIYNGCQGRNVKLLFQCYRDGNASVSAPIHVQKHGKYKSTDTDIRSGFCVFCFCGIIWIINLTIRYIRCQKHNHEY